jgi:hypothetical protein
MRAPRLGAAWILIVGLVTLVGGGQSRADVIAFDFSGNSTTVVNVTGVAGGTMKFTLDLGDPSGSSLFAGDFSMDVKNSSDVIISSVNFLGLETGNTTSYGDVTGQTTFDGLSNLATWTVTVLASDLSPVRLGITSTLTGGPGDPAHPVLTADFTGDLQIAAAAVPGPVVGAGLPGLLLIFGGIVTWSRRRWHTV